MRNIESSSIVVQWEAVDDFLTTTYITTWEWYHEGKHKSSTTAVIERSSYEIIGLTLDTVYTIIVTAATKCGTGPEFIMKVSFYTTSTTSSISPTVTASTNPMTIMSAANPNTATAVASSNTITASNTTSIAHHSTNGLMNSTTTTNLITAIVIRDTDTTSSTIQHTTHTINASASATITTAITNTDTTATTTRVNKKSSVAVTATATTTVTVVSCIPTVVFGNPADTNSKFSSM